MTGSSENSHPLDRAFQVLCHPRRRHVLLRLVDCDSAGGELQVNELGVGPDESGSRDLRLRHVHLPKLVDAGYVRWNEDTGTVRPGPNVDEIEPVLRLLSDHGDELPGTWTASDPEPSAVRRRH